MPNHVANRITGPSLEDIRTLLRGDTLVDFNRLIPMPPALDVNPNSRVRGAVKFALEGGAVERMVAALEKTRVIQAACPLEFSYEDWNDFIQCLQNKRNHGRYFWYDWRCEEWGTKWNAYNENVGSAAIYFETAWSCPNPIVKALAGRLSKGGFRWEYADEDYGRNLGVWEYQRGRLEHSTPTGGLVAWAKALHWDTEEEEDA